MIRSVWEASLSRFARNDGDEDGGESTFVPSPLDVSVRSAHGGDDVEVERELRQLEGRAARIEREDDGN